LGAIPPRRDLQRLPRELSPIVEDPELALPVAGVPRLLAGLARRCAVVAAGQRTRPDLVETFDDAPSDQTATVEEQRAFADAWREERKQR